MEQKYFRKYLYYKQKYLNLQIETKNQLGGNVCLENNNGFHQKKSECWHDTLLMIILFSNFEANQISFGDLEDETFINPIQKKLLDSHFILHEFIYDDRESSLYLLPINFDPPIHKLFELYRNKSSAYYNNRNRHLRYNGQTA